MDERIGWAAAKVGKYHDQNGPAHLLLNRDGRAVAACGARGMMCGQAHNTPPDYARGVCSKCEKIAAKVPA